MNGKLPFCETTLLINQFISPILFGLSKGGKKAAVLQILGRYVNRNAFVKAEFANSVSMLFVNFRKMDSSPKVLKNFLFSFIYL